MLQYFPKAKSLAEQFKAVEVKHIPQEENARAETLYRLSSGKESGQLTSVV